MAGDIVQRCLSHPPVDTTYVAGLWHHSRVNWRGFVTEARVHASAALKTKNKDVRKFLIVCRARSGSTLTTQFLNEHPEVTCDREVLVHNVISPRRLLDKLATKSTTPVYGCKLLSYQMIQVHRFKDPKRFLKRVADDGYSLIHLERETFQQVFSLYMAQTRQLFHQSDGSAGLKQWSSAKSQPVEGLVLDVKDFTARLEWSQMMLDYEREVLRDLPHINISYETDLPDSNAQQATAQRLYDWLGVAPFEPRIAMKKVLSKDPKNLIKNFDELEAALKTRGLAHLLPS